jgi:hypothetical protein
MLNQPRPRTAGVLFPVPVDRSLTGCEYSVVIISISPQAGTRVSTYTWWEWLKNWKGTGYDPAIS